MKDLIKKLRRYEIQIRKYINSQMQGDFHSVFKGSGLEFDDYRPYQYGDDVRAIDWNLSAKGHGTFIKTFKEEKEQTVYLILDVSGSQKIGDQGQQKIDIGKEIAGVLTLAAIKESSQVGMICFSDQQEKVEKPGKGGKHAFKLIKMLVELQPQSIKTNLSKAFYFALATIKKRSMIIVISDFIDEDYEQPLKALAAKHDLITIQLSDQRETALPSLGIVPIKDMETGRTNWVNTSFGTFRNKVAQTFVGDRESLEAFCRKNQINYLGIDTKDDFVPKLIKLFKIRNRSIKRA
ncbi:DUF58 domain-containing protein [Penaeicola halotolerans]|uniref:DUF58 domain-containing protein n=1 Tax=Penaeicola halotolerans TaxID=2793196 RepID=UPI001CF805CA|nr:DUF58 domain-containing protein [Penaeicola halotolerans]